MNAYDEFYSTRTVKNDYSGVIEYLNKTVFTEPEQSAQEFIFFAGNEYCKDLPDFYPLCKCFWDAYTEFYFQGVQYFLETHSIKSGGRRYKKIKEFTNNINNHFDVTMDLRQEIFIEHQQQIDENLTANKKNVKRSAKNKRSNLNSI